MDDAANQPGQVEKSAHRTYTKYWDFGGGGGANKRNAIVELIVLLRDTFENAFKIKILRSTATGGGVAFVSFPTEPEILELRLNLLRDALSAFLSRLHIEHDKESLKNDVRQYDALFRSWPHQDLSGGMGYNNGLVLYCFSRAVRASMVIESGVWRGFTTFILDAATDPAAKLSCFDINLKKVVWKSGKADYYERDLTTVTLNFQNQTVLAFFDDHFSQYDRIQYSYVNGFSYVVFDDDLSHLNVHSDGWPAIPTISMVWNENQLPEKFGWVSNGRHGTANFADISRETIVDAYHYVTPPDLFEITGYRDTSRTSYLVRKAVG